IPSPNVAENHQYHNAMALVNAGAAVMIEEKDLTDERLLNEVNVLLKNPQKLRELGENARKLAVPDSAQRIMNVIDEITQRK
ncbi:glycosyltransferase, partial [Escherichia coli]